MHHKLFTDIFLSAILRCYDGSYLKGGDSRDQGHKRAVAVYDGHSKAALAAQPLDASSRFSESFRWRHATGAAPENVSGCALVAAGKKTSRLFSSLLNSEFDFQSESKSERGKTFFYKLMYRLPGGV